MGTARCLDHSAKNSASVRKLSTSELTWSSEIKCKPSSALSLHQNRERKKITQSPGIKLKNYCRIIIKNLETNEKIWKLGAYQNIAQQTRSGFLYIANKVTDKKLDPSKNFSSLTTLFQNSIKQKSWQRAIVKYKKTINIQRLWVCFPTTQEPYSSSHSCGSAINKIFKAFDERIDKLTGMGNEITRSTKTKKQRHIETRKTTASSTMRFPGYSETLMIRSWKN